MRRQASYSKYVSVLIPLAIPKIYAYHVPEEMVPHIAVGKRVEVSLKSKRYAGLIVEIFDTFDGLYKTKPILSFIDDHAIVNHKQLAFWQWISEYYACTLGEVMNVALPQGLKLSSETKLVLNQVNEDDYYELSDEEYMVTEALTIRNEIPILDVQEILQKKSVYPVVNALLGRRILNIKEELKTGYKPKEVDHVRMNERARDPSYDVAAVLGKSENQMKLFLAYQSLDKNQFDWVPRAKLVKRAEVNTSVVKALEKKGIFEIEKRPISRIKASDIQQEAFSALSKIQLKCIDEIKSLFKEKQQVLLHGVTGSGKTQIYIELIKETIEKGGQVLYLLPEIGLTTQIVNRLRSVFGDAVGVYHSRMNHHERVEIWQKSKREFKIMLAARSGLFLPIENLQLIVVDEEHDPSFKQTDPAPRYNARDAAVYLSNKYNIKLLLGTATPSLESYNNVLSGKYGLVELMERYGDARLPDIEVIDLGKAHRTKKMHSIFSRQLLDELKLVFASGKQAILFQNRRGYAPVLRCITCGWIAECNTCDVKMTVHKYTHDLRCHYCGKRHSKPDTCVKCGSHHLVELGFGTEKIEDEIQNLFPEIKVQRLDYDTTKSKSSYLDIIGKFESGETDLLVGTQMITKGLDFDNVGLVAILNADQLLHFPDFRANERSYQLLTQVAGRAGRKREKGRVLIQTYSPTHPVILETVSYDFHRYLNRELLERKRYIYPPYFSLIYIKLKHKKNATVWDGAKIMTSNLRKKLSKRVFGPTEPGVARIRGLYIMLIVIKAERNKTALQKIKSIIMEERAILQSTPGLKSLRINVDVDPY